MKEHSKSYLKTIIAAFFSENNRCNALPFQFAGPLGLHSQNIKQICRFHIADMFFWRFIKTFKIFLQKLFPLGIEHHFYLFANAVIIWETLFNLIQKFCIRLVFAPTTYIVATPIIRQSAIFIVKFRKPLFYHFGFGIS